MSAERDALTLLLAISVSMGALSAQSDRPRISPHEHTSALVGGARITITYGRPSMRGRKIFGALVPYGRVWCPGADEATTLDATRPLQFGSVRVAAGPHTIWMLPTADRWTLIISKEASGFHTQYHEDADLGRIALTRRVIASPVEQLTFAVASGESGGLLTMSWDTTSVSVSFTIGQ